MALILALLPTSTATQTMSMKLVWSLHRLLNNTLNPQYKKLKSGRDCAKEVLRLREGDGSATCRTRLRTCALLSVHKCFAVCWYELFKLIFLDISFSLQVTPFTYPLQFFHVRISMSVPSVFVALKCTVTSLSWYLNTEIASLRGKENRPRWWNTMWCPNIQTHCAWTFTRVQT